MFLISLRYFAFHPASENFGLKKYSGQMIYFTTLGARVILITVRRSMPSNLMNSPPTPLCFAKRGANTRYNFCFWISNGLREFWVKKIFWPNDLLYYFRRKGNPNRRKAINAFKSFLERDCHF